MLMSVQMPAEEPLSQYRRTCAFCSASCDILHPKGCRKFVCGNDKDRIGQRLVQFGSALMSCHSLAPPDGKPGPVLIFLGPGAKLKHRSPSMFKIVDYWSNV